MKYITTIKLIIKVDLVALKIIENKPEKINKYEQYGNILNLLFASNCKPNIIE